MLFSTFLLVALGASLSAQSSHQGAVSSQSSVCSGIGKYILKAGGNAVDAAVATQFCVGVIGMYHSGLGGGGFATVRSKEGEYEFVDFREMAPAAAFSTMYAADPDLSLYGGLASGVPGEVRGLEYIHRKYGILPWSKLVSPSVQVARAGFPVTADLVRYMADHKFLVEDPAWAIDFAPNGTRLGLGDIMTRKRLGDTLDMIARKGPDAFYHGASAAAMIQALRKSNGIMTLVDLANYTVVSRPVSNINYRGYQIYTGSAPSGGAVVSSIMKTIEGYDMSTPSKFNESVHYLKEAMRFAYGQRTQLGDPTFSPNLTAYQEGMYSEETAAKVRRMIDPKSTLDPAVYNPGGYEILTDSGTSAVVASDKSGLTISLTSTINTHFGSCLMVPETGVIMNNGMNDFSIPDTRNAWGYIPTEVNYIQPFKRPLSSISPTIVEYPNKKVFIAHASAGGSRIISQVVQHLWHTLDRGLTSAEALAEPRMHDQLSPNEVSFEWGSELYGVKGFNNETTAYIASLGAQVTFVEPLRTTAQSLRVLPDGSFEAAGEPRQLSSAGVTV